MTQTTGVKYYTLAFIVNANSGSSCNAEWGGTILLSSASTSLSHLDSDISYIRGQGGDILVHLGAHGLAHSAITRNVAITAF